MDYNSLSGLDKAAILFQVLGEPLAVSFFSGVSKEKLMQVRVRSNELAGKIPTIIKKQILDEYSFMLLQDRYRKSKPDAIKLFEFLDDLSEEEIFYLLSNEAPTRAALAIDQVDDKKRANFINRLDSRAKNDIILELGNLKEIPLEMVVNVAKELRNKTAFLPTPKEFSRGGPKSIANILNQMGSEDAEQYLEQIATEDPELYTEVKKHFLSFEDLLTMPEHIMQVFWRSSEIDVDNLGKAFKGYDEETKNMSRMLCWGPFNRINAAKGGF